MSVLYRYLHLDGRLPFGKVPSLLLVAEENLLRGLYVVGPCACPTIQPDWVHSEESPVFDTAKEALEAFFSGEKQPLDLPYRLKGTPLQEAVWRELRTIPYGGTLTYKGLAQRIRPHRPPIRAVASAVGRNPITFLLPCHRVIGSDGSLRGYAYGLELKGRLLAFERKVVVDGAK